LIAKRWDPIKGYSSIKSVIADIYVFAVHTCMTPADYDPLDVDLWDFYVIPGPVIKKLNQGSMALSTVRKHAGNAISWADLRRVISEKAGAPQIEPWFTALPSGWCSG